jgi:hypothetical protein
MAGVGKIFVFHGAFKTKAAAVRRERARPGSFVTKCKKLFCVVTPRNR